MSKPKASKQQRGGTLGALDWIYAPQVNLRGWGVTWTAADIPGRWRGYVDAVSFCGRYLYVGRFGGEQGFSRVHVSRVVEWSRPARINGPGFESQLWGYVVAKANRSAGGKPTKARSRGKKAKHE